MSISSHPIGPLWRLRSFLWWCDMLNVWKDPKSLTPDQQVSSVRVAAVLAAVLAAVVVYGTHKFLATTLDFESPLFLVQQSVRVGLAGFPIAALRSLLALGLGFGAVQALENTQFGQRLTDTSKGIVYAAIFVAVALAFGVR